jgi:hypothetical protein
MRLRIREETSSKNENFIHGGTHPVDVGSENAKLSSQHLNALRKSFVTFFETV